MIQSFDSIEQLDKYAEEIQDFQLSNISKIVKDYADEFPNAIYEMMKLTMKKDHQNDKDAIVLSTVHAAKGQEYDRVIIDQDIADAISRTKSINPEQFHAEINVAYVCFTRAKKQLLLPMALKTVLTPQWQSYIEKLAFKSYDRTMSNKAPTGKTSKKIDTSIKSGNNQNRCEKVVRPMYKVGDRVETSNGYGTIIEIVGDQCRIDLEGQTVKMWDKLSTLKYYNL